jgi:hypothetical protein
MRLAILGTALAVLPLLLWAYDSGPDPNSDGGPGGPAAACAQSGCHAGTAVNAGGGKIELQFPNGLTYTPGQKQRIRIVITDATPTYGYQLSARLSSNETRGQAGTFTTAGTNQLILCQDGRARAASGTCSVSNPLEFFEHSRPATSNTIEVDWTPPTNDAGNIRFYVAGVAANNNGQNTGDRVYTANYTLTHTIAPESHRQITTFAGTGAPAFSGDTGPATAAALNLPQGVTVDGTNGVYIADAENHRVRLVAPDGTIRTIAGIGTPGANGDNGQATAAQLRSPLAIAMDGSGGFYIADTGNHRIRRVFANGIIVTVAGTGTPGFSGDGGFATAAQLNLPSGLAADAAGNLYISEYGNHRIRKLDGAGLITTVAGTGVAGFNGDNQPATTAQLNTPRGLSLDAAGNLLVADFNNHRIRKLTPGANIATIAGTGASGFSGDGGPATAAQLQSPSGVAVDSQNSVYIADYGNHRIRKLSATGIVTTYAGTGTAAFSGDGGNATAAHLNGPWGVAVNSARDVFIADAFNHRIRRVIAPAIVPTTFDSLPSGLTLTIGGTAITAPATLQLEAGATISISAPATQPLTAGSRLGFASWSDAGAQSHSITVGPSASTFVANYTTQYLLTRSVTPATGGSITATPSSIDGYYPQNTAIQLTANPATGFAFTAFSGDATGATVTMSAPRSVTAAFACSYQPSAPGSTVTAAPGAANFSVTTGVGCTVTPTSDAAWLTATATGNTVSYSYSANLTGLTRTANITTGNARFTVTQSPFLAPVLASATPPNTTTITQTFTLTARDANGVEDLNRIYFLVNTGTAIPINTCHGFYERTSNSLFLYDDMLTTQGPPLTPGAAGSLQNSQCIVNGATSSVTATGTDLTLNLNLTRQGANAAGAKNLYVWVTDTANMGTGWIQASTWPLGGTAPQPPTIAAATPANATAPSQVFTITARDNNGFADISRIYFLLNSDTTVNTNGCHGFYDRAANAIYLYDDALATPGAPLLPGAASAHQNSQCAVTGTGTSVTASGTDLTLNLNLSRQGAYATGTRNLYVWATDNASTGTGWILASAWAIATPNQQPPVIANTSPATSSATAQTFAITVRDPNGANDLSRIYFLVNSNTAIPANSCHGFYERATNALFLYNDALTALSGPITPGAADSIQNTQCVINAAASSVTTSGTDLTLNLKLTRQGGYATGTRNLYLWATDSANAGTGWQLAANWAIGAAVQQPPTLAAATPATASTTTQTFTLTGRDPNGATDISRIYFLLNTDTSVPSGTCHGFYDRPSNSLYLYDDALTTPGTPLTPGTAGTRQNSQCAITGPTSSVSTTGTDLTLTLTITRQGAYTTGTKSLYTWITDAANTGTGWLLASTWNTMASPQQPPSLAAATPALATTATQTFSVTARDPNGATDINRIYFLVNANTSIPAGTCHGFYDRPANAIYLYNDALTTLSAPLVPGTAATIQNSQCAINGATTSATASGTDLILKLSITRQGSYATGTRNLYTWITDTANTGTGWLQISSWQL